MSWNLEAIRKHLGTVAPNCIDKTCPQNVSCEEQASGTIVASWQISVKSDPKYCSAIGHLTKLSSGMFLLFDPVAIKGDTKNAVEIFDSTVHGYHRVLLLLEGNSAPFHDESDFLDRVPYTCGHCGSTSFLLRACYSYPRGGLEIFLEDPNLPISDLFSAFNLFGVCQCCFVEETIAEFDGL